MKKLFVFIGILFLFTNLSLASNRDHTTFNPYKVQQNINMNLKNIVDANCGSFDTFLATTSITSKDDIFVGDRIQGLDDINTYQKYLTDDWRLIVGGLKAIQCSETAVDDNIYIGNAGWNYVIIGDTTAATVVISTFNVQTGNWFMPHNVYIAEQGVMKHLIVTSSWTAGAYYGTLKVGSGISGEPAGLLEVHKYTAGLDRKMSIEYNRIFAQNSVLQLDGISGLKFDPFNSDAVMVIDSDSDFIVGTEANISTWAVTSLVFSTSTALIDASNAVIKASSFSLTGSGVKATISYDPTQYGIAFDTRTIINGSLIVNGDFDANGNCIKDVCTLTVSSGSNFVGEHHDYAEIYIATGTEVTSVTTQNQWVQVKTLHSTGAVRGLTISDHEIVISTAGTYFVYANFSFTCSAKDKTVEFGIFKNNMSIEFPNLRRCQLTNGVDTCNTMSVIGIVEDLEVDDTLEIWARCTCSADNSIVVKYATFGADKR